jgi:hypothetical protein
MKPSATIDDEDRAPCGHAPRKGYRYRGGQGRSARHIIVTQPFHEAAAGDATLWQKVIE